MLAHLKISLVFTTNVMKIVNKGVINLFLSIYWSKELDNFPYSIPHSHVMCNKIKLSQIPNTPTKIPSTPSKIRSTPSRIPNPLYNFSVTGFLIQSRIPTSWAVRWSGSDQIEFRTLLSLRPNQPHSTKNGSEIIEIQSDNAGTMLPSNQMKPSEVGNKWYKEEWSSYVHTT